MKDFNIVKKNYYYHDELKNITFSIQNSLCEFTNMVSFYFVDLFIQFISNTIFPDAT